MSLPWRSGKFRLQHLASAWHGARSGAMAVRRMRGKTVVAGHCETDFMVERASRWVDGEIEIFNPLEGYGESSGTALDANGSLYGVSKGYRIGDEFDHGPSAGVFWGAEAVELSPLEDHDFAYPLAVNSAGIATGLSIRSSEPDSPTAVFWYEGKCFPHKMPGSYVTGIGRDVNDGHIFTGGVHDDEGRGAACVWCRGESRIIKLPHPAVANRIDNNGVVAGWWLTPEGAAHGGELNAQPWLWRLNPSAPDLGTSVPGTGLGARFQDLSEDVAIDRSGKTGLFVVNLAHFERPYVMRFDPESLALVEGPVDLNDLVTLPGDWWSLDVVNDIWDGVIVGVGTWRDTPQAFALHLHS